MEGRFELWEGRPVYVPPQYTTAHQLVNSVVNFLGWRLIHGVRYNTREEMIHDVVSELNLFKKDVQHIFDTLKLEVPKKVAKAELHTEVVIDESGEGVIYLSPEFVFRAGLEDGDEVRLKHIPHEVMLGEKEHSLSAIAERGCSFSPSITS